MSFRCSVCGSEPVAHLDQMCTGCRQRFDEDEDYGDDDERDCFHCGGEGYVECRDPIQCTRPHIGGAFGMDGGEVCPCGSCGGSGLAKDMTIW